jgi:hypothetical protein
MFIGDDNCISAQRPAMLEIAQVRFRSAMAKNTCRLRLKSETPPGGDQRGLILAVEGGPAPAKSNTQRKTWLIVPKKLDRVP